MANQMPEHLEQVPVAGVWAQDQLAGLGVYLNVQDALRAGLAGLQIYASALIQNALGIFTSLLGLVANLFFVLIIGFIITLDGPRLLAAIMQLFPDSINVHLQFLGQSIDRTFGGFIRGQLLQALLQAIGTAVVMSLFGLNFVLVAGLFGGLFMLIPLVGPFLALLPPLLAVVVQSPGVAIWVLAILLILQLVITNILMPRLMSEAVGLHPLLVFAAIIFSIKIAGFWGAFFGIPVAGVLWAMAKFLFVEWREIGVPVEHELTKVEIKKPLRRWGSHLSGDL
jgi:predicted PurR-regulated permease PerM